MVLLNQEGMDFTLVAKPSQVFVSPSRSKSGKPPKPWPAKPKWTPEGQRDTLLPRQTPSVMGTGWADDLSYDTPSAMLGQYGDAQLLRPSSGERVGVLNVLPEDGRASGSNSHATTPSGSRPASRPASRPKTPTLTPPSAPPGHNSRTASAAGDRPQQPRGLIDRVPQSVSLADGTEETAAAAAGGARPPSGVQHGAQHGAQHGDQHGARPASRTAGCCPRALLGEAGASAGGGDSAADDALPPAASLPQQSPQPQQRLSSVRLVAPAAAPAAAPNQRQPPPHHHHHHAQHGAPHSAIAALPPPTSLGGWYAGAPPQSAFPHGDDVALPASPNTALPHAALLPADATGDGSQPLPHASHGHGSAQHGAAEGSAGGGSHHAAAVTVAAACASPTERGGAQQAIDRGDVHPPHVSGEGRLVAGTLLPLSPIRHELPLSPMISTDLP